MPKMNKKTSLFIKYFVIFAGIITVSLTVLGVSLMAFVSQYTQDEKTKLLKDNVFTMANTVRSVLDESSMNSQYTPTKKMIASTLDVVSMAIGADVFVTSPDGKIILCKERNTASAFSFGSCDVHDQMIINQEVINQIGDDVVVLKSRIGGDKRIYYIVASPISVHGDNTGYVFSITPIRGNNNLLGDFFKMFLMSTVIALLLSFLSAYALTYRLLTPLKQMSKAAKKFAQGDFSYRVNIRSNDEMEDLGESFNEMATELAALEGTRRSFVANVSHELKTPMTTISGFIDGILDGTIPPERQGHYLKVVSDEVKRLSRLVVAMLNMSRIESGDFKMQYSDYKMGEQVFNIFLNFEQRINDKNIEIVGLDKLEDITVHADPDMIYQAIYNLVDNAVKFTNEGGYIETSIRQDKTKTYFEIKNSGNGISSEELPRIFHRFYKVDRSRSLDVKGAGLGLYIVKNMIEMHGGQIAVQSEENNYTKFEFWIAGGNSNE